MKLRRSPVARSVALAFGSFLVFGPGSPALAQQQQLERVEVTGSRVKRIDAETASPVQVLTREDIERSGKQSIQEVLRSVTADSTGSIPASFSNGFAAGAAAVSLRGLGVNSTLVLVNGRRMSTYGLADDGTRNFVDLNTLPLEAVERIEVLKDGASAIYGADAVGGVVNVILRKDYKGASIGASYGRSQRGDGATTRAYGSFGLGDIGSDKYNAFFTFEASSQGNIWSKDRGFIGQSDLTSLGYFDTTNGATRPYFGLGPTSNSPYGVTRSAAGGGARVNIISCDPSLQDATTGLCRYNPLDEQEVQPKVDRLNVFGRATAQINSSLQAYGELGLFSAKMKANGTLGANNDGGVYFPGDPFNPLVVHGPMTLPASHPDNTFGVARTLFIRPYELGGRDQTTDNSLLRGLVGLQGSNWDWDWDVGVLHAKSKLKNVNTGFIIYDRMQEALNNGTYRIARPSLTSPSLTSRAVLDYISPALETKPTSSVTSVDFKATRDLMKLDGGSLALALGAEYRRESTTSKPVPFTDTASVVGLGYAAFDMSRSIYAVYGELVAPLTKWFEVTGALRHDRYSDFGSTTNPKVGFKLQPAQWAALRGTYSEAFRAPGAAEVGGSSFGFTSYAILSQGNPNIKPETAKSYSLGVVLEPIKDLSATFDYWDVTRKQEIIQADPNAIIGSLPTTGTPLSKIPGAIPNTFIYYNVDGDISTVTGFYQNAAKTVTNGYDAEVRYRWSVASVGRFTTQLNWTHVNEFKRTDVSGTTYDYAGTHGPLVQSAGGGGPKDRATLAITFDRGAWAATLSANYVGKILMIDHKGEVSESDGSTIHNSNTGVDYPDPGTGKYGCGVFDRNGNIYGNCKLPAFTTYDLFAKWTPMKNLDINLSVQNLFDKKAPFDPYLVLTYGINYNQTWHQAGAVGRFYTLGARYSF